MQLKNIGVIEFSVFLAVVIVLILLFYRSREKSRKKEIRRQFQHYTESYRASMEELRMAPRVLVPDALEIVLTLTDGDYFGLKARVVDMSLSGFGVRPDFPLKRLPLNVRLKNVLAVTPVNSFVVREMRTVRIDHQVDKRLLAFHIEKIDGDQFQILKTFMSTLDEFIQRPPGGSSAM